MLLNLKTIARENMANGLQKNIFMECRHQNLLHEKMLRFLGMENTFLLISEPSFCFNAIQKTETFSSFSCVNCRFLFDPESFVQQSQQLNNSKVYLYFGSTPTRLRVRIEIVWESLGMEFTVYFISLLLLRCVKCCGA